MRKRYRRKGGPDGYILKWDSPLAHYESSVARSDQLDSLRRKARGIAQRSSCFNVRIVCTYDPEYLETF